MSKGDKQYHVIDHDGMNLMPQPSTLTAARRRAADYTKNTGEFVAIREYTGDLLNMPVVAYYFQGDELVNPNKPFTVELSDSWGQVVKGGLPGTVKLEIDISEDVQLQFERTDSLLAIEVFRDLVTVERHTNGGMPDVFDFSLDPKEEEADVSLSD